MSEIIKTGYQTPDGVIHDTKAAAMSHLRRPLKARVLNALNGDNQELTDWILDNEEAIGDAFQSTTIRRVKKSEYAQLEKALAKIKETGDKAFGFVIENADAILESFRWPSVKRGTPEEQAATIKAAFMALTGDNAELADWLIANKDTILEAFEAGVEKRQVSEKAAAGLAAYRAKKAAEKQAKEAEEAAKKAAEPAVQ